MNVYKMPGGVQLSERALEVGLAQLRKRDDEAHPWQAEQRGPVDFIVRHTKTREVLRGAGGRLRTWQSYEAAQKAADKANAS